MKNEAFYDTDVLASFLSALEPRPSVLRILSGQVFGMTSVLQAAELYAATRDAKERSGVDFVFYGVRVLGFHSRYAADIGRLHRESGSGSSMRDSMTAGFCVVNRVPLVTFRPGDFLRYRGLRIIDAAGIRPGMSWNDVTAAGAMPGEIAQSP
jgi:predicted nucleic acid-binding protein